LHDATPKAAAAHQGQRGIIQDSPLRLTNAPVVLLYHRVGDAVVDPWALAVSEARFSEQLDVLGHGAVLPVSEMLRRQRARGLSCGTAAITFDDGYAETMSTVQPRLNSASMPATFYIPSGAVDRSGEFWWDELEALILLSDQVPHQLAIDVDGQVLEWRQTDADAKSYPDLLTRSRHWRAWEPPDPSPRHALYRQLWERCQRLTASARGRVIADVREWAGREPVPRESHRSVTSGEVRQLVAHPGMDVGAHSVTHPALAALSLAEQQAEIDCSKRHVETLTGAPVETFAYPFGRKVDYSDDTVAIVKRAGFLGACANFSGAVEEHTDPFQLPRLFVQDWDADEFRRHLASLVHE
jgi:peptidoglycan/xylan/chitin deacetylase (PgdA/CDA1 family)